MSSKSKKKKRKLKKETSEEDNNRGQTNREWESGMKREKERCTELLFAHT